MRNQKTFFDEFNAMQTVVETEYDSDGEVQGQNQLNQKNEVKVDFAYIKNVSISNFLKMKFITA